MSPAQNRRCRKALATCVTGPQQPSPERCLVIDILGSEQCCSSWLRSSYPSPGWALPVKRIFELFKRKFFVIKSKAKMYIIITLTLMASMLLDDLILFVGETNGFKLKMSTNSNGTRILV